MQYKSLKIAVSAIAACLCFTACDDSTSKSSEKIETYSSVDKLPDCKSSNEGETVRVEKDSTVRVCANGSWYAVSENEDGSFDYSCETKALKDSSGVKIICGGDSVGVVKNTDSKSGKNGTDGKNGVDGKNGTDGHDGKDGSDGSDGKDGKDGADGHDGKDGSNGSDGKDGKDGADGHDGKDGTNGSDGKDGKDGIGCTAKALPDNSGMKVFCGADTVGVILNNGLNGTSGAGCSLKQIGETLLQIKCGNDSAAFFVHEVYDPNSSSSVIQSSSSSVVYSKVVAVLDSLPKCQVKADMGKVLVRKDSLVYACDSVKWIPDSVYGYALYSTSVLGSAVKGPFKFNSTVTLKELRIMKDSKKNDSLAYAGRVYEDEISSDKGNFVIPKVSLAFPYAEVAVTGKWRNEVTGKWSDEEMTLYALTEFTNERKEVNVNLLTHLEYARAKVLVNKGYNVYAAKRQADYEILRAFGFATDVEYSEDLITFKPEDSDYGNKNATLLAMSLLVLGERSTKDAAALVDSILNDIATDGVWDDVHHYKLAMANWAASFDVSKVRKNLKNWNVLDVPGFEKYLSDFWNNVYGLGGCDESRKGDVVKISGDITGLKDDQYFICKNGSWQEAEPLEYDTYGLEIPENEGEAVLGLVNNSEADPRYYYYEAGQWHEAPEIMYDTLGWNNGDIGEIRKGGKSKDKWYIYTAAGWKTATVLQYDTYNINTDKFQKGEVVAGVVHKDNHYVWETGNKKFREALQREVYLNRGCYSETKDEAANHESVVDGVGKDSVFWCTADGDNYRWKYQYTRTQITDDRDDKKYWTVQVGTQTWMAENLRYRGGATSNVMAGSKCHSSDATCTDKGVFYTWAGANSLGSTYNSTEYSPSYTGRRQGACPKGWAIPSLEDWETLYTFIGYTHAAKLYARNQAYCPTSNPCTDDYGFGAKKVGYYSGTSYYSPSYFFFWSAKEYEPTSTTDKGVKAYYFYSYASSSGADHINNNYTTKTTYYPVRCIKNSN